MYQTLLSPSRVNVSNPRCACSGNQPLNSVFTATWPACASHTNVNSASSGWPGTLSMIGLWLTFSCFQNASNAGSSCRARAAASARNFGLPGSGVVSTSSPGRPGNARGEHAAEQGGHQTFSHSGLSLDIRANRASLAPARSRQMSDSADILPSSGTSDLICGPGRERFPSTSA